MLTHTLQYKSQERKVSVCMFLQCLYCQIVDIYKSMCNKYLESYMWVAGSCANTVRGRKGMVGLQTPGGQESRLLRSQLHVKSISILWIPWMGFGNPTGSHQPQFENHSSRRTRVQAVRVRHSLSREILGPAFYRNSRVTRLQETVNGSVARSKLMASNQSRPSPLCLWPNLVSSMKFQRQGVELEGWLKRGVVWILRIH